MSGNYPAGVTDNHPEFDMPSAEQESGECWNCGGEGCLYDCFDGCCEDADAGCDECTRACDICKGTGSLRGQP